jgi:hypothetical protein
MAKTSEPYSFELSGDNHPKFKYDKGIGIKTINSFIRSVKTVGNLEYVGICAF